MDTSQAHLSSKPGSQGKDQAKPDNLSKDELTAVLKYGAQKMFDKDDSQQTKKLDDMNLDDVLKSAEDHETMAADGDGGTSLGGEGFLAQFAAVSDVKNDMNWEDIIPRTEQRSQAKPRRSIVRGNGCGRPSSASTVEIQIQGTSCFVKKDCRSKGHGAQGA